MHPPDGPPVCAALKFLPAGIPPPISNTISLNVVPIGTSTKPTLLTFPPNANTFVPLEPSVPIEEYHLAPFNIICGTVAYVSTLLINVGLLYNPEFAGNGGFNLGSPLFPSTDSINAVSSPHTNAPAPSLTSKSKLNPVFQILFPSIPYSFASSIAI